MTAKIYKPGKNPMQSGPAASHKWVLEFPRAARYINKLTGWTGAEGTSDQIVIEFDSEDEAINYAEKHGIDYELQEFQSSSKLKTRSYADNFKYRKPPEPE